MRGDIFRASRLLENSGQPYSIMLADDEPSPINPPSGCPFHPRCRKRQNRCVEGLPRLRELSAGHWAACHLR
ncbi:MAG: oligopeptide/dipeptide ABC transporter ATP-binding protein [Deltaproteobacteria bacterium]